MDDLIAFFEQVEYKTTHDVVQAFGISRQAAHKKLAQLVAEGKLMRTGSTNSSKYMLPHVTSAESTILRAVFPREGLGEELVWYRILHDPRFPKLSLAALSIFQYAFNEMLNNAIEHSGSKRITIELLRRDTRMVCRIRDAGKGVFHTIQKHYHLPHEQAAIQDLLKGKTTTAPAAHSGEGIFFTSKAVDLFRLSSYGWELIVDNDVQDVFVRRANQLRGTLVEFEVDMQTTRQLEEVFRAYTDDQFAFSKTEIRVKLFQLDIAYLSRSQGRRITDGLEKFKKVILDCADIDTVGQAFADEIFRVWQNKHPEIEIIAVHCAPGVEFMIRRAGGAVA